MSWEVSTMPSKRSFFNRTLFLKNLGRFWPLWGGVSLAGAMLPLYLLLAMLQRQIHWVEPLEFAEGLSSAAAYLVPAFTCGYAILCAMAVWGYLCNSRSAGMMHALPVDRTCLFATGVLSGLAMILIPYAVTGGLLCLIALFCGAFHLTAVVTTVLTVAFAAVLFFGMATLCAMLTGHALVLPVFYLLANFLAHLMEMLVTGLAEDFLLGVWMTQDMGMLGFLSPVMQIYRSVRPVAERLPDGTLTGWRLQGLWVLGLYALAGLALLALAWYLYRRRHSESAGDVVAFRWLRPVFRYGLALLSGLTAGRLLYELFWRSLFQQGAYAERRPMMVCVFLGGMLGYYIASMLLEKSLRVFRGSWRGAALVAAGAAALCLLVSIDLFGVERRVPEPEEIESVTLLDRGGQSGPFTMEDAPETAAQLAQLHRAIVADRDYIRTYQPNWDSDEVQAFSHTLHLIYHLKNGKIVERYYDLWLEAGRVETPGTYDNLLAEFYSDPAVILESVSIPGDARLEAINVIMGYMENGYASTSDHAYVGDLESRQIYAAILEDAAAGRVPARNVTSSFKDIHYSFCLELEYLVWEEQSGAYYGHCKTVFLAPSMTSTTGVLLELGYLTETELAAWEAELARQG